MANENWPYDLLSARKNIVATDGVCVKVDRFGVSAFDDVNATVESLCVTVARECTDVRSTTCYGR